MRQFLSFRVNVGRRLIPVENVVEVIPMVMLQRETSDDMHESFCGLLNFRGQIIPAYSLSAFDFEQCMTPENFLIVAIADNRHVAILAKEVDYLLDIPDNHINPISPSQGKTFSVAKYLDDVIRIVNPEELFA